MNSYSIRYKTSALFCQYVYTNLQKPLHVLNFSTTRVTVLFLFLTLACSGAWAQAVTGDKYSTSFTPTDGSTISNTSTITIQHHPAMWYSFRDNLTEEQKKLDTFDDDGQWTSTMNGTLIQAAHVYVDTIYMHKGDTIHLVLPYTDDLEPVETGHTSSFFDLINYFRWFDYKTDGLYNCNIESGSNTINDLLTPTQGTETAYRFANGYVSGTFNNTSAGMYPATRLKFMTFYYPTDAEFSSITANGFNGGSNDYYLVACDVSSYMDFAPFDTDRTSTRVFPFGTSGGYYEPTLNARTIFYIVGVDDVDDLSTKPEGLQNYMNLLDNPAYQGGGDTDNDKYIEEYEITYPSRRLTDYTNELVALSKSAHAYAIPNATADKTNISNPISLTASVSTTNNTAGIALANTSISGQYRSITFYKSDATIASNGKSEPWQVEDGSTATILVTKTVGSTIYNIARFKLTFKEEFTPLTQSQIGGLSSLSDEEREKYWWGNMTYRSPEFMEEKYELLNSITFDYDEDINAAELYGENTDDRREHIYPFPLDWGSSSYSYISGLGRDEQFNYPYSYRVTPGEYAIANTYYYDTIDLVEKIPVDVGKKTSTGFWVNVDATDAPGTLAILEFGEDLCPASKLYVTAWIKSLNYAGANEVTGVADASSSVLLTITGVYPDGSEVPVYRYASSQIRHTNSMPLETDNNGTSIESSITGVGEGTNEWFQLYFSFINQANTGFDHYALKIDNRSENSSGADYVYDEIKVYVEEPEVEMVQLDPICATSNDDKGQVRLDIDYEIMMSRLGFDPDDYTADTDKETAQTASVDFVIINESQYRNALAAYEGSTDTDEYKEYQEEAFKEALVIFYDGEDNEYLFPTLDFYRNYSLNEEYVEGGMNILRFDENGEGYFYRRTDGSTQYLSVDCLTNIIAYAGYMILLEPHTEIDKTTVQKLEEFISLLDDQCAIKTEFYLSSETMLKLNGETIDPTADYCAGQEFVISPEVTYTDSETGETIYLEGEYFDWFFGSVEEYLATNYDFGGVSLNEALIMFRTFYPDAEELSETETPPTGTNASDNFTQDHYDIIAYYLAQERTGGKNNMLVLHLSHLDMRMLSTGLELVIQPIEMHFDDENIEICFGYVPLTLYATGDAPTLKAGFNNINYPDDDYEPCLRLGLAQMENCSETSPFTINLCKATYVTEAEENGDAIEIDHLGVAEGMDMLFLVDTDDPNYRDLILDKADDEEIVIGKVARLYATTDDKNDPRSDAPSGIDGSYMQIYFYGDVDDLDDSGVTPFTVREGYYYVVSVYFQEKGPFDDGEQVVGSACWGIFPLEMKIVPEYLVWTGDKTGNWNNDNHWRRADKDELNKPTSDSYPTNEENETDNGFVPMLFSKVIIPRDSEAELYMAGFEEGSDGMLSWSGDEEMEGSTPTTDHEDVDEAPEPSNIMYDMMLYENPNTGSLKTEHYRVNLCDEIHFEPGAQLLHSEQLIYNKAWTDVEIPEGKWLLTATPLEGVFSGDWYTKKATGTETAEYFTDITFNSENNNRVSPIVYQRSWSNLGNQIIYNNDTDIDVPAYLSTGWSSVYNDVNTSQQAGEGFSIKAFNIGTSDLMFRFPKADETYQYQEGTSSSMTDATTAISRGNSGQLLISDLVDRSDPDKDDDNVYSSEEVTVDLTQTSNAYYIIGNPFTAQMSMEKFMDENTQFKGYWLESTYGPIAGTSDGTSWGTVDCLVEPYSAFFVTMDDTDLTRADDPTTIKFTKDMQTLDEEDEVEKTNLIAFSVRATNNVGTTAASLSYSKEAIDGYKTAEDAVLMEDATWKKDGMPLVYTVADDMAVSINKLNALTLIPLGCFADDDLEYTLTFVGVENLNEPSLYDAYTNTDTPLTEGYTLEMMGETHGRYFIRSKSPSLTGIDEIEEVANSMSAYSPNAGTIVVSAEAGIETLEVYSLGGILLGKTNVGGNITCTLDGIDSGIAIVRVRTLEGTFVRKIRVK